MLEPEVPTREARILPDAGNLGMIRPLGGMTENRMNPLPLPPGVRSRIVPGINDGLAMHVLEAGTPGQPAVLLLHGFPELAYSWRKVMPALAGAGYHVLAPDQRGYGRTTGWDARYDGDLGRFRMLNLVRDAMGLLVALDCPMAASVVGHDFGAPVAAWCALLRPDLFRSLVLMSFPFAGPPALRGPPAGPSMDEQLAALPCPRQHYQTFYCTPEANVDLRHSPQGVHDFLRAYYHHKSADWADNRPEPLAAFSAAELARLPRYYVMDLQRGMAETVAEVMPTAAQIAGNRWLPDDALRVYSDEFQRTGFQGGLNWYRCMKSPQHTADLQIFTGRTIGVPSMFIAGRSDWGTYQRPGDFETMQTTACSDMRVCHLIEGAGHWVQQEQPGAVNALLLDFLCSIRQNN
jgi:pimeloyl-ACP methyl ester carboxylesterase